MNVHLIAACGAVLVLGAGCAPSSRDMTIRLDDGQEIYVRAVGHGPDSVLVVHHGPGLHGAYLVPMLNTISGSRTLLVYDQRGRGRSDPALDTARLSVESDLADLERIRVHFGLRRVKLMGHGWGAALAAMYAMRHAGQVERLLLVSPLFPRSQHAWGVVMFPYELADSLALEGLDRARMSGLDRREPARFCRQYWGAWLSPAAVRDAATIRALRGPMCDAPPEALARVEAVNRTLMRSLGSWDLRESLRALAVPTLLIQGTGTGSQDSTAAVVWRASTREWTESVPNSGLVFLRAPSQFPWLGDPAGFERAANRFLSGAWPANARAPRTRITAK